MAYFVKQLKNNKYKLWSTITDSYITNSGTREEIVELLIKWKQEKLDKESEELRLSFPHGYFDLDRNMIHIEGMDEKLQELYRKRIDEVSK
jgi:hypothetical protein